MVANWTFLTNHARVLPCIAHDPGVRLRDIAASLGITERTAYGIRHRPGRGRLHRQAQRRPPQPLPDPGAPPLPEPARRERTVGEVLTLLDPQPSRDGSHRPRADGACRTASSQPRPSRDQLDAGRFWPAVLREPGPSPQLHRAGVCPANQGAEGLSQLRPGRRPPLRRTEPPPGGQAGARGTAAPIPASVSKTSMAGITVFKIAIERWHSETSQRDRPQLIRELLDELKAVAAGK
jgi:hypothetical protein